ncbi:MAG: sigma-70 family RNA polymerase sigma factor [Hungatella sp.]|nr:sigma-70 family RNA polymerase sigma factor [Hungatella sp.]
MHQEQKELLQELYETYQKAFRLFVLSMRVPVSEVDDIIQDSFVAFICQYGEEFTDWSTARQKGTLMKILRNRCYDYFRGLQRHKEVSFEAEDIKTQLEILSCQRKQDFTQKVIDEEELSLIRESILAMSQVLQEVAILYMIEGRPREKVCEILNISDSTCRMRISRIRSNIRKMLKERNQLL